MSDSRANAQAAILKWLMGAIIDLNDLRRKAKAIYTKSKNPMRTEIALLLYTLGDTGYGPKAVHAFSGDKVKDIPKKYTDVENHDELILYTLSQKGCSDGEIKKAISYAQKNNKPPAAICL